MTPPNHVPRMRPLIAIICLFVSAVIAEEIFLSDAQRTEQSAAIFTGTVVSTNFLRELKSGALCSAQLRVQSIEKAHPNVKTNALIYFEQRFVTNTEHGFRTHGSVCPGYPEITKGQTIKVWSIRWTVEGHTNILFVPTSSWAKKIQ